MRERGYLPLSTGSLSPTTTVTFIRGASFGLAARTGGDGSGAPNAALPKNGLVARMGANVDTGAMTRWHTLLPRFCSIVAGRAPKDVADGTNADISSLLGASGGSSWIDGVIAKGKRTEELTTGGGW